MFHGWSFWTLMNQKKARKEQGIKNVANRNKCCQTTWAWCEVSGVDLKRGCGEFIHDFVRCYLKEQGGKKGYYERWYSSYRFARTDKCIDRYRRDMVGRKGMTWRAFQDALCKETLKNVTPVSGTEYKGEWGIFSSTFVLIKIKWQRCSSDQVCAGTFGWREEVRSGKWLVWKLPTQGAA